MPMELYSEPTAQKPCQSGLGPDGHFSTEKRAHGLYYLSGRLGNCTNIVAEVRWRSVRAIRARIDSSNSGDIILYRREVDEK